MAQKQDDHSDKVTELRQRAEEQINHQASSVANDAFEDMAYLLHELKVHTIELEMQNEELKKTQLELETSQRKYTDLYEFSPVGLFALGANTRIQEPNMTLCVMLGIAPHQLAGQDLTAFIEPAAQDAFHVFYHSLKRTQQPQQCEIVLIRLNQETLVVRLDGTAPVQVDGGGLYRVSATDLTAQRQAEVQRLKLLEERQEIKAMLDFMGGL
jgi:two-component system, cell cycle sensor histidine kinase and response regulator CckA